MASDENRAMEQVQKHREIVTNVISEFNGEMHPEKDTYPEFFYCRDIIKAYESSLNH